MHITQTLTFASRPRVRVSAAIVGPKEGAGPLGGSFDIIVDDDLLGMDTFEQAEAELLRRTIELALDKAGVSRRAVGALLCGDLLNQTTASSFAARQLGMPLLGLFGACSTMIEALLLGGVMVDGGYRARCACAASSHFCTAERQFRFPLELGNQRPPSAQWTATAAGAILLDDDKAPALARLTHATIGRIVDYQVKDVNQMGAAMAPAVADTLRAHMDDVKRTPDDYDLIITGDLGIIGRDILLHLLKERGMPVSPDKLFDCGANLFAPDQDAHAGGSGCGCVASVLSCHFVPKLARRELKRILVLGSGALLSPTSSQQGESIPGISHGAVLEVED